MTEDTREGAKQTRPFDPARAARLDDPTRFSYLPLAAILALLDLRPGATLLDFGAGTGTYAIEIARTRPDVRIFAVDEQPAMLGLLKAKLASGGIATVEAIEPPGLDGLIGRCDRILALNVLHELSDAALRRLGGLLAPAGQAVFVDWNGDTERPVGPPADRVYGVSEAQDRLERLGFAVRGRLAFTYHYAFTAAIAGGEAQR